jgi:hypothetical protein
VSAPLPASTGTVQRRRERAHSAFQRGSPDAACAVGGWIRSPHAGIDGAQARSVRTLALGPCWELGGQLGASTPKGWRHFPMAPTPAGRWDLQRGMIRQGGDHGRWGPVSVAGKALEGAFVAVGCLTISIAKGLAMRTVWKIAPLAAVLSAVPLLANAGKVEGVGIGAGVGAIVAGPVGAVVGGVVGYKVGGPNIVGRRYRSCWRDEWGYRHCRRR